ncbi:hypothetical protein [Nocardiopsis metallicus]|uniref:Uncharacterized protein n=1 Tax=Nocardiopsis metallicus TaxID=179819 RepID=A0A840W7N7_9ACTN|nr:hypothetical protein [Nocardiopsis metallicus]MBB5491363.1 hypothetical protein [Nocardiopsis metallicus]
MSELTPAHLHAPVLPPTVFGDGHEWMENLRFGWKPVPAWGLGMWDLGKWPLVIVVHLNDKQNGVYAVATYTEGDITCQVFTDRAERDAATDEIAAEHWRLTGEGPFDLPPEGKPLLSHHRGLFTWDRYHAEKDQLPEPKEGGQ